MGKLTRLQREWLEWVREAGGVTDVTDERTARALEAKGMAFKFFESQGDLLKPVWTITPAGRAALEASDA